jgi:hypothetical protein
MGRLTNTQKNAFAYVQQCIGVAIKRVALEQSRFRPLSTSVWTDASTVAALDTLFSTIAGFAKPPIGGKGNPALPKDHCFLLANLLSDMLTTAQPLSTRIHIAAIEEMHKHAVEYDMLSQMPRVRRTRKKRKPQTLVEARAGKVDEKVREWERKLKYAKTKLSAYRKKQKYYSKKGEVV